MGNKKITSFRKLFFYYQKMLLGTQNASGPCDSDPADKIRRREAVVFDNVGGNECARSPESSLRKCKFVIVRVR